MVTALLPSLASDAGGGDASSTTLMVGALSTGMPSWAEAAAAVPRLEESAVCTAAAVVEAGTAMVAVMSTLAAATRMETNRTSTPAASAMTRCKLEVSAYSLTSPRTVRVSTTAVVDGGGAGKGGGQMVVAGGDGDGGGGSGFGLTPIEAYGPVGGVGGVGGGSMGGGGGHWG